MLNRKGGTYKDPFSLGWDLDWDVDYVVYTVNGPSPALSEYIAYDNLPEKNPFIAVTQDGLGKVVYDGGFPKIYNSNCPESQVSLTATFKYFTNAINWVCKAGVEKKVLVLGTANEGQPYSIKDVDGSAGFRKSLDFLAISASLSGIDYRDVSDYGAQLNPSFAELSGYAAVIFIDSVNTQIQLITDNAISALMRFREAGGGLLIVTDHGGFVENIEVARRGNVGGFFFNANKIASELGVYFTGSIDRADVSVAYLKQTYGDHPLYAGLNDAQHIYGGNSESKVVIHPYTKHPRLRVPQIPLDNGNYYIQVLAKLSDGSIKIFRDNFIIDAEKNNEIRTLFVRAKSNESFIKNFNKGGWKIGHEGKFVQMLPTNTKMWDADLNDWVSVK